MCTITGSSQTIETIQVLRNVRDIACTSGAGIAGYGLSNTHIAGDLVQLGYQPEIAGSRFHGRESVGKADSGLSAGQTGGDDGLHSFAGIVLLCFGKKSQIARDMCCRSNNIRLAQGLASCTLVGHFYIGAADDEAGVEREILLMTQLLSCR